MGLGRNLAFIATKFRGRRNRPSGGGIFSLFHDFKSGALFGKKPKPSIQPAGTGFRREFVPSPGRIFYGGRVVPNIPVRPVRRRFPGQRYRLRPRKKLFGLF